MYIWIYRTYQKQNMLFLLVYSFKSALGLLDLNIISILLYSIWILKYRTFISYNYFDALECIYFDLQNSTKYMTNKASTGYAYIQIRSYM